MHSFCKSFTSAQNASVLIIYIHKCSILALLVILFVIKLIKKKKLYDKNAL